MESEEGKGGLHPVDVGPLSGIPHLLERNRRALEDPDSYWRPIAEELVWFHRSESIFQPEAQPPFGSWFSDWETNLSYNCLDRWMDTDRRDRVAFHWEGEPGDRRVITYKELCGEVNRLAAGLQTLGVGEGDRVTLYLPMVPELVEAMLAVVRLGAVHSVVFAGFSAPALADRINDSGSKLLITADGGWRRGNVIELKQIADAALTNTPTVERCIVVRRTGREIPWNKTRDLWFHDLLRRSSATVTCAPVRGPHPSFVLYTSGTTGKPKGAVHSTGGYMLWVYETQKAVFHATEADVYWCTADIGWVTGHSYIVYGPLLNGLTSLIYEGAPDFPQPDRWWELIERYGVSVLYTSPTAIRSFLRYDEAWIRRHDLSSLRLLGTVGESINPEAWRWYHRMVGGGRCPIVDTWWQTETGGIMISPQPGFAEIPLKPGSATFPLPGVDADVVGEDGKSLASGEKGLLVLRRPWPGEFVTLWRDPERYRSVYFSRFPGCYYTGDFALRDKEGYFWLLGRADEVLKVAGHRLGTIEIEDALITHPAVAESAVIGKNDPIKGETPVAFVILKPGNHPSSVLRAELLDQVRKEIGPIAVPSELYFVEKVPKTRSAKIMRRLIRDVVEEKPLGDATTLEDETSVEEARRAYAELKREIGSGSG